MTEFYPWFARAHVPLGKTAVRVEVPDEEPLEQPCPVCLEGREGQLHGSRGVMGSRKPLMLHWPLLLWRRSGRESSTRARTAFDEEDGAETNDTTLAEADVVTADAASARRCIERLATPVTEVVRRPLEELAPLSHVEAPRVVGGRGPSRVAAASFFLKHLNVFLSVLWKKIGNVMQITPPEVFEGFAETSFFEPFSGRRECVVKLSG